jgi:hypothetical protein
VVQRWIDDATELLSNMMYTCCLDVAWDYPDGLAESSVALLLGVRCLSTDVWCSRSWRGF